MPHLIIYTTRIDAEVIRTWINKATDVAWIVKAREEDCRYVWKAVWEIDSLQQQEYAL